MTVNNIELFSVSVTEVPGFLDKKTCKNVFDYVITKKDDEHYFRKHTAISKNSDSSHLLFDFLDDLEKNVVGCENLKSDIRKHVTDLSNRYGMKLNGLYNSWINIQQKHSILHRHIHEFCMSGALYINVDEDSSGICFYNPDRLCRFYSEYINSCNNINCHSYYFSPKIGDMYIFPGWLEHSSPEGSINMTDNRMVISFNFFLQKN